MLVELRAGTASAQMSTIGSTLLSWDPGIGHSIIDGYAHEAEIRASNDYRSGVLAPWVNRIAGASWPGGASDSIPEIEPEQPDDRALHGLVSVRDFDVQCEPDRAVMTTQLSPTPIYPAPLDIVVTWQLDDDGDLHLEITARHGGNGQMPLALGWHPYFYVDDPSSAALEIDRGTLLVVDPHLIPLAGESAYGRQHSGSWPLRADEDFAFARLGHDTEVSANLVTGSRTLTMTMETEAPEAAVIHLYTGRLTQRGTVAIEPCTAMANAFNRPEILPSITFDSGQWARLGVNLHAEA